MTVLLFQINVKDKANISLCVGLYHAIITCMYMYVMSTYQCDGLNTHTHTHTHTQRVTTIPSQLMSTCGENNNGMGTLK